MPVGVQWERSGSEHDVTEDGSEPVDPWSLLAHVDTAIGVVQADGTITQVTRAIEAITGFPSSHYRGRHVALEVHPDDIETIRAQVDRLGRAADGTREDSRVRMATVDGGWIWVDQVITRALDVRGVHGYVSSVRDVDRNQRTVQALKGREVALRALLRSASDAVVVLGEDGRVIWVTEGVEAVSGWTEAQIRSMDPTELIHADDLPGLAESVQLVLDRGSGVDSVGAVTCRLRAGTGEYRWLDVDIEDLRDVAEVGGVALALRDSHELVVARRAVASSERRFRALVQHGSDVVFTFDDDLSVTSVTDAVVTVLGYSVEEALEAEAFANVVQADRDLVDAVLERLRDRPGGTERLRLRVRDAAGHLRWNETRITNLLGHPDVGEWVCNFWDVTAMVRTEEENRRLLDIFELTDDSVLLVDAAGDLMYLNAAGRRFFGVADERVKDLIGTPWPLKDELNPDLVAAVNGAERFESWSGEVVADGVGGPTPAWLQVLAHRGADDGVEYYSAVVRDISDRKRLEATLEHQATHDPLTGLPNRALLFRRIGNAVEGLRATGSQHRVGLLFIDLDRFKTINDSLGHALGDRLLRSIGERIRTAVRPGDTVARFGGDEFVVLCERLDDEHDAVVIAHRIESTLQVPFQVDGHEINAGVSIGIAFADPTDPDPVAVLRSADTAMYRAKSDGRGRWVMFDEDLRSQAVERQRLETALRQTRHGQDLVVDYQPVVELLTGRIVGAEALVRWTRDGTTVPPDTFIPLAEDTGLIVPIGAWVLRTSCEHAARWQAVAGNEHVGVAVNVSARQLQHPGFVASVERMLSETGVRPPTLCLEITETVLLDDVEQSRQRLEELRGLGVRIAVDDFGTGYSSLTYLHRLPIDVVKLDQSFVRGVGADSDDTAIVTAVVNLAGTMGLDSVAEGIETELQLAHLRKLGCRHGQGFLLAPPLALEEFVALLADDGGLRTAGRGDPGSGPGRTGP